VRASHVNCILLQACLVVPHLQYTYASVG